MQIALAMLSQETSTEKLLPPFFPNFIHNSNYFGTCKIHDTLQASKQKQKNNLPQKPKDLA
ncbi:MAG: hypothetical protein NWE98_11915 [Candidatus Bathyarchaeota archaeon]|nr:hypothetical protein [Candidatus Bathyarchaeota archaeon]